MQSTSFNEINKMKIYEYDNSTDFVFEAELYIDAMYQAHFDTSKISDVTDLLKQHGIYEYEIQPQYLNENLKQQYRLRVINELPEEFYYDLTTKMMQW